MIKAKPIVDKEFWILKEGDEKVGNIQAVPNGYSVTINNMNATFKTLSLIKKQTNISFDTLDLNKDKDNTIYGFDPKCKAYNAMFDVEQHLPLFTKTRKSKSWFAAGWYNVFQHNTWIPMENPKLITLQRYNYEGPFKTSPQRCI